MPFVWRPRGAPFSWLKSIPLLVGLNGMAPVLAASSGQPQSPPSTYGTGPWLFHYLVALTAGLSFLVLLNDQVTRRANRDPHESLAKEAARLRRLVIGYPEGMTIFEELRATNLLERRFSSLGLVIEWRPYPSASSLLNDLSLDKIQFCGGGGTASIFSQAAHHCFYRVASEKYPELDAEAILVQPNSDIRKLSDLRGLRIAYDEGSSAHYVLVRALQSASIPYNEIEHCHLPQQDALPLFVAGRVDAWVVWMPYALNEQRSSYPGRSIGDLRATLGESALDDVPTLYYATPELVRDYPRILKAILEEVNEAGVLVNQQRLETALRDSGADRQQSQLEVLRQRSLERALVPLDEKTIGALQQQANLFHQLGILSERVNVRDGAYSLRTRQNWTY